MLPLETNTRIFIVKIWLEEVATNEQHAVWRGQVKHVPTGQRHYFNNMKEFHDILQFYLQAIGIKIRPDEQL
jgi:hypothetical protein